MNNYSLKDAAVIIRSTGERTEELCKYAILQNGISEEQISYVKNVSPFSKALRKGFELALEQNYKYTFFIDADQVILPNIIRSILSMTNSYSDKFYFINFLVYDFLSGTLTPNGPHLYHTKYLEEAIKIIPSEATVTRPESAILGKMAAKGFINYYVDIPSSFHEFEQYYRDSFRHAFNKFHKMSDRMYLIKYFRENIDNKHFELALKAFEYAMQHKTILKLEYNEVNHIFEQLNVKELSPIQNVSETYDKMMKNLDYIKNDYLFRGYSYQFGQKRLSRAARFKRSIINSKYYMRIMKKRLFLYN